MKLTKADWREINTYKKTKLDEVLDEFIKMDTEVVEVTEYTNKTATSCQSALFIAIKRRKMENTVGVMTRGGKVYLINKLLMAKHEKED